MDITAIVTQSYRFLFERHIMSRLLLKGFRKDRRSSQLGSIPKLSILSILAVSVRDPGGDLTKGFSPSVPRYQQPLTLMAEQATKGKSGISVEGYWDYRGVRYMVSGYGMTSWVSDWPCWVSRPLS